MNDHWAKVEGRNTSWTVSLVKINGDRLIA